MISASGLGSGLDVESIVRQLLTIERQPVNALAQKKSSFEAQLSSYGKVKSALSTFRSALKDLDSIDDFKLHSASSAVSGDQEAGAQIFTASANSSASLGTTSIEVVRMAERHKLAANTTYSDNDTTTIGTSGDTATITVGSDSFVVDIGAKTLNEIRDEINDADDNTGVTATVINDDAGYRLVLTADESGSESFVDVSYSGSDVFSLNSLNSDRDGSGIFDADDLDAELLLEGQFTATRTSNTINDVITGVTLELKGEGTADLTITRDIEGVQEAVQSFVDAYNEFRKVVDTERKGALSADNSLLTIERAIRNEFNTAATGIDSAYSYLAELGVLVGTDGKLAFDEDDLEDALENDFSGVAALFGDSTEGIAYRLGELAGDLLESDGLFDAREDGINASIDSYQSRIDLAEQRLGKIEERIRAQFSALDGLVANLQATGSFLSQQLALF